MCHPERSWLQSIHRVVNERVRVRVKGGEMGAFSLKRIHANHPNSPPPRPEHPAHHTAAPRTQSKHGTHTPPPPRRGGEAVAEKPQPFLHTATSKSVQSRRFLSSSARLTSSIGLNVWCCAFLFFFSSSRKRLRSDGAPSKAPTWKWFIEQNFLTSQLISSIIYRENETECELVATRNKLRRSTTASENVSRRLFAAVISSSKKGKRVGSDKLSRVKLP